jgi:hypothetical protein
MEAGARNAGGPFSCIYRFYFTQELKEKRDTWIKYTKKLKEFKGQGKGKTANETFIKNQSLLFLS